MEHTRNQKRMYRIKKLEERIVDLENISKKAISELSIANDKLKKTEELLKTEKQNHLNNVKLCNSNLENLLLSSAICTCDQGLRIIEGND